MQYCTACSRLYPNETEYCPKHGVALEPRDEFGIGTLVCGRYEIIGNLGSGAMGEVFLVHDQKLRDNNRRAMKVPLAHLLADRDYLARFMNEAEKTLSLFHPSIVRCFNVETTESGTPLLLMEFLEGEDLRFWMNREPSLKWRHIREIAIDMTRALESAHSVGIIHCDIKPENVRATGPHPTPLKVLDFGLAKAAQTISDRTVTGSGGTVWDGSVVAGTLNYMSPEQAVARGMVGPPSDIYSLGVVLFEMLTGHLPYRNIQSADEARALHTEQRRETLRSKAGIPSGLPDLVETMLNRAPDRRPTASEVVSRLTQLPTTIVDQPIKIVSSPPPVVRKLNHLKIAGVVVVLAAIGTFLVFALRNSPVERVSPMTESSTAPSPNPSTDSSSTETRQRLAPPPQVPIERPRRGTSSTPRDTPTPPPQASESALETKPKIDVSAEIEQANAELSQYHYATALRVINRALQTAPGNKEALATKQRIHGECDPLKACEGNQ